MFTKKCAEKYAQNMKLQHFYNFFPEQSRKNHEKIKNLQKLIFGLLEIIFSLGTPNLKSVRFIGSEKKNAHNVTSYEHFPCPG
jgi:hypothetical protein